MTRESNRQAVRLARLRVRNGDPPDAWAPSFDHIGALGAQALIAIDAIDNERDVNGRLATGGSHSQYEEQHRANFLVQSRGALDE
jgi:hypothetical protein